MSEVNLETGTILIVDDTPNNLRVLSGSLVMTGWEILVAVDGEGAIEQAEYSQPDLILLDVMMPGMDGFDTCRHLKANSSTQNIPIIFMTALADIADKVKGFNVGAVDYITKPFEHEEVVARIKNQLKIANLTKQVQTQNLQLQNLAQELEQRVEERTVELSQTLQELQQETQVSLVQREKMSALGELVAGIAHEINNPISSINGNIGYVSTYIKDLLELLKLYQAQYPDAGEPIAQRQEDIELEYLLEDLPKALTSVEHSIDRIVKIVDSIRHFSRRDEATAQLFDIHEGLDSTLVILSHRLKGSPPHPPIQVIKEYADLPPVVCYTGPINQVFMNFLSNAIDAIEEAIEHSPNQEEYSPTIWIRTKSRDQKVAICIADNGRGMSAETQEKLLEPRFTTKSALKGTGLGLSISRQIIEEQHGGSFWFTSELGQGSEFWMEIPLTAL